MKKSVFTICLALFISVTLSLLTAEATEGTQDRYIGLHDRLLPIEDIRVIESDTKVPLEKIAKSLYIPYEKKEGITYIRKRGIEITYNHETKVTTQDGTKIDWSPIVDINGTLFISVKYIAHKIGFEIEYIKEVKTLRIYRDDYDHMNRTNYIKHIQLTLNKKQKPSKAQKSADVKKANVYLTFDDGPNKFTSVNNATLKKYNVQGTFFFLGKHMKNNEKIVSAVVADGHYIGTHSMTHDHKKVYKSAQSFIDEMNEGTMLIKKMTGNDAKLLRVPYGSAPHVTPAMQKQLNKHGFKMWDWDVDSNDWKYTDKQANQIVKNIQSGVEKAYKYGDRNIIILMHDRSQTAKALPQIIEWLQKEGYTIETYKPKNHVIQNFLQDESL